MLESKKGLSISNLVMNFDYLVILVISFLLYIYLLTLLFSSFYIMSILDELQVVGFYPILFDALLFFYILFLIRLYFKRKLSYRILSFHFTSKSFSKIILISIIYILIIGFFIKNFNPIAIIQILQGNVPFFAWLTIISLIIEIIALIINQTTKKITIPSLLITLNFYVISVFFLDAYFFQGQYITNFSYLFPLLLIFNIQTITFDYARIILNKEEYSAFIDLNAVPTRVLINADVFTNESEYNEAMKKGAQNRNQLYIVNSMGTETYEEAVHIQEMNFPDLKSYNKASALGMRYYSELQEYELKQQVIDLKEKIQRKKRIKFNNNKMKLLNLLKKTNKINLNQLLEFLEISNSKYLLIWLSNTPDDYPVKLEGDYLVLNENLSQKQLTSVIDKLLLQLDAKFTITLDDVEKVKKFFTKLKPNIRITLKQLEEELGLSEEKLDYIILFMLSKVSKFVNYNVEEGYIVRKDFDIEKMDISDFTIFIEDMSNFVGF